ncbi:hypothetical protein GCM10011583_70220 [Streptomyces camponoticapitis]|uniref:Uncharacterized protein n=1 Tax=Streptomyces camponoticapitis TaxID=1616125 RepID=A0ABQ2EVE9_9ACTN|nr:hypothetical protein GCM10011583_70220 [Streptomyces camponoticapitis]
MQQPVLTDAYAASTATGIKPGTIHVRIHRHLTRHGYDPAGHALGGSLLNPASAPRLQLGRGEPHRGAQAQDHPEMVRRCRA